MPVFKLLIYMGAWLSGDHRECTFEMQGTDLVQKSRGGGIRTIPAVVGKGARAQDGLKIYG